MTTEEWIGGNIDLGDDTSGRRRPFSLERCSPVVGSVKGFGKGFGSGFGSEFCCGHGSGYDYSSDGFGYGYGSEDGSGHGSGTGYGSKCNS